LRYGGSHSEPRVSPGAYHDDPDGFESLVKSLPWWDDSEEELDEFPFGGKAFECVPEEKETPPLSSDGEQIVQTGMSFEEAEAEWIRSFWPSEPIEEWPEWPEEEEPTPEEGVAYLLWPLRQKMRRTYNAERTRRLKSSDREIQTPAVHEFAAPEPEAPASPRALSLASEPFEVSPRYRSLTPVTSLESRKVVWVGAPRETLPVSSPKTFEDSKPPRITSDKKRRKLKKRDSCYVLPTIPMKRKPFASSQRRARSTQAQDPSSVRVASSRRRRKVFMGANQNLGHSFSCPILKNSQKAKGPSAKPPKKEFAFGSLVRPPDK
jgi:hypothetical protein